MKPIALAAAFATAAAAFATAAAALPPSQLLSNSDLAEIQRIVPSADLSALTVAQMGALALALHGNDRGDGNNGGEIRAILK